MNSYRFFISLPTPSALALAGWQLGLCGFLLIRRSAYSGNWRVNSSIYSLQCHMCMCSSNRGRRGQKKTVYDLAIKLIWSILLASIFVANQWSRLKPKTKRLRETLPTTLFPRPVLYQIVICVLTYCRVVKRRHWVLSVNFASGERCTFYIKCG